MEHYHYCLVIVSNSFSSFFCGRSVQALFLCRMFILCTLMSVCESVWAYAHAKLYIFCPPHGALWSNSWVERKDFHPSLQKYSTCLLGHLPLQKAKALAKVQGRYGGHEFRKKTCFRCFWPASRMSLFPSFLFASNSIYNAALMISWLFDEGVFCSPFWSSNSMK